MPAAVQQQCFGGRELRKFDQVNRLAIPAKFRSRYGNTVYLLKNFQGDKCIIMYSEEDYLTVYDNIAKSFSGAMLTRVQRLFVENTDMAVMDKAGRITVSPEFQKFAPAAILFPGLIINNPDRIELWNESNWNSQFTEEELPDLSNFNISPRI